MKPTMLDSLKETIVSWDNIPQVPTSIDLMSETDQHQFYQSKALLMKSILKALSLRIDEEQKILSEILESNEKKYMERMKASNSD